MDHHGHIPCVRTHHIRNIAVAVGLTTVQLDFPLLLILAQQLMSVMIPYYIARRFERAPHDAVQNHSASSLHVPVGIAN
jgi:hypothetical protein